jgi:hypothetical protein
LRKQVDFEVLKINWFRIVGAERWAGERRCDEQTYRAKQRPHGWRQARPKQRTKSA